MVRQTASARQARVERLRCLVLPETFPILPRFSFGDWVKTSENDFGQVVGMTFYERKIDADSGWVYQLSLSSVSPNYQEKQGVLAITDFPDWYSPSEDYYSESELAPF